MGAGDFRHLPKRSGWLLFLVVFSGVTAVPAQDNSTRTEFWPEVNLYVNLKPRLRLFVLGTVSKSVEDGELLKGDAFEGQFGAHLDYVRNQHLSLRAGYRYGTSIGDTTDEFKEHRLLTEQTLRKQTAWNLLLSDRNREDFRSINHDFSFRYRNRLTVEREFRIPRGRTLTPYVSAEAFFDTRYNVWNKSRFGAGVQIPLKRGPLNLLLPQHQTVLDVYYLRQHDTRSSTTHLNALGIVLAFYL